MTTRNEKSWTAWLAILRAAHAYILDISNADDLSPLAQGRCGLAIASTAMMLEAYTNLHMESLISEHLREAFQKLSVPQRYLLYPRFAREQRIGLSSWESDAIHPIIKEIFVRRNSFVHGNVAKLDIDALRRHVVVRLWNAGLNMIERVELEWLSRIPANRAEAFRQEVSSLRVTAGAT